MIATNRELLRIALLRGCEAASPMSLPLETLADVARNAGFDKAVASGLEKELDYLVGKGWLESVRNSFSQGQKRWKLTSEGRDVLEREGLA